MGENAAIKRFDPRSGTNDDLFTSVRGRLPVVLELLKSPWISRASDLLAEEDAASGKRVETPIEVAWDGEKRAPAAFTWKGRRHGVDALVQTWAVERRWWDDADRVSRRCFRVLARGGVYDLAYDRLTRSWLLVGIVD